MRQRLGILLLAVFVAVDIVLVVLAVHHTSGPPPASRPQDPIGSVAPSASARPTAAAGTPSTSAPAGPSLLAVTSGGHVLRAGPGSCSSGQPPVIELSAAHGRRLAKKAVPGLSQPLSVTLSSGHATIVGLDQDCATATFTSDDDGATWSTASDGGAGWHVVAAPRKKLLVSPAGRRATPCAPEDIAPIDDRAARLLCRDGRVEGTGDGGDSWVLLGSLDGAVDLSFEGVGDGVALAKQDGCPAAVMTTADGGTTWTQAACLQGGRPRAIASSGETEVAQAGDVLQLSTDGGRTWTRVRG